MPEDKTAPVDQKTAEAKVEDFRRQLGPFVAAAEKTRMAMIFTNATKAENPIVFANDSFLRLTGFSREDVLGMSFMALMTRGCGSEAMAEIEAALAGTADSEPEVGYRRSDGTTFWASVFISPVCDDAGKIEQHFISFVDQTRQREKQTHCNMLIDELNHRVKNSLSTVQSIARQSIRASDDPKVIGELIESRLFALSRSHDLLTHHNWEGAGLHDLIDAALKPFGVAEGHAERFKVEGENILLTPKATLTLGIAFHELATNAAKYGALSNDVGSILISWESKVREDGERLLLTWQEKDGPSVAPPKRKGFGSQVLERGLAHELSGKVKLDYLSDGLRCNIDIPLPRKAAGA